MGNEQYDNAISDIGKILDELQNPYPKDIFKWDNKESLKFNRGRFNQHCFEIWENCKNKISSEITALTGCNKDCECDCHAFVGGSGEPCPECSQKIGNLEKRK